MFARAALLTAIPPFKFVALIALGLSLISLVTSQAFAVQEMAFWPKSETDPAVPTLNAVLGHAPGEKITGPSDAVKYLQALVDYAPAQTRLVQYATSFEGRPLVYLIVSSEANMDRLAQNQANMQRLADPRLIEENEANELIKTTLPVSWLSYGVHGDEISSTDAALLTAYYLLAARHSAKVDEILNNTYVVLDPSQNPDGRARFISSFEQTVGIEPALHPLAAEHRQPWPGGRFNHYLFDMNRDWFALTQPETQGKVSHYLKLHPVVHVDLHEMGVNESYFFPPPVEPYNPHIIDVQKRNLELYGKGNAKAFDEFKFDYFTREIFDAYYPGYGDTWPSFQGAVGMTFEMASARGLAQLKSTGETLTYRDGVQRHFVASMATLLTTAENAKKLLTDYVDYRRSALGDKTQYIFRSGDRGLQLKLARLLSEQGVEVEQTSQETRACGWRYDKGTFVVKASQPAGRLVRTLLDAESPIPEEFWEAQERKRDSGQDVELYDILAWSLPALYNIEVINCASRIDNLERFDGATPGAKIEVQKAQLAYLVPGNSFSSVRLLAAALRADLKVDFAEKAFSILGKDFPAGSLIFKTRENAGTLHDQLVLLANKYSVPIYATDSGWTKAGINFGSDSVKRLIAPKIAIAWDEPTEPTSAGSMRFVIERRFGYPTTPIRTRDLRSEALKYFDVLILPDGYGYKDILGDAGLSNIEHWVNDGGTLITAAAATRLLLKDGLDLLNTKLESNLKVATIDAKDETDSFAKANLIESEQDYRDLLHSGPGMPDNVPGVIVQGVTNNANWLAGGVAPNLNFMLTGNDIYTPLKYADGVNLVSFSNEEDLVVGGYLWKENKSQLAYKPAVMTREVGAGQVIAFVTDPTFRGYMDGLDVLLGTGFSRALLIWAIR